MALRLLDEKKLKEDLELPVNLHSLWKAFGGSEMGFLTLYPKGTTYNF